MGMMSYPNFGGSLKPLRHPDLTVLARLGEKAGVDMRFVAILRDPVKVMVSTTVNRHFGKFADELRILRDNQIVLLQQLREVDPRFVVCHDFDGDVEVTCKALSDHFGLGNHWEEPFDLCGNMERIRKEDELRHEGQRPPEEHFDATEMRLLEPLSFAYDQLKQFCSALPQRGT